MCRIRYINKNGERATKNIQADMRKGIICVHSASATSANGGIQVSYRRYTTMIYPQVKG